MYTDQPIAVLVQIRQKEYVVHLQFHPTFKQRLLDIASQMTNNNVDIGHYMSELLIRDSGGILPQEDYINKNYISTSK